MGLPPAVTRWASVDLGSNTFRLLLAEETAPGELRPGPLRQRVVRLAEGLRPGGTFRPEARARAERLLEVFRAEMDAYGALYRVGALAAAGRNAADGPAFARRAGEILGGPVRIVSGEEEARLSLRGALGLLEPPPPAGLFLDIGGGSTEVAAWEGGGRPVAAASLPVGVVSLWEAGAWSDPPAPRERATLTRRAAGAWDGLPDRLADPRWTRELGAGRAEVVATAGTPLTVAAEAFGLAIRDTRALSGRWVPREALAQVAERFWAMTRAERAALPSVEPGREDVILPGLSLLETFLDRYGAAGFRVSDGGLLEGILLEAVERERGRARLVSGPAGGGQ
ncbi:MULTISPECIES: Ppx/GppA phosphatase family protein [Deferrisoma]